MRFVEDDDVPQQFLESAEHLRTFDVVD